MSFINGHVVMLLMILYWYLVEPLKNKVLEWFRRGEEHGV